jgi:amidase
MMSGAADLRALRDRLATSELSAAAAVEASLARIAALDGEFAAFLTVAADQARAAAVALDQAPAPVGPLHGVPIAVKDLTDTAGIRTTYGSALFRDHVPAVDDLIVARLKRAGAVVIGKTMTPEFGFGAVCVNPLGGPTRNPFDRRLTSGGSSGGSAVAVATGMVPVAPGTDFGGSVRTPASFCGIASLRPTPGMLPSPTRKLGWDMLATAGFLGRSVDDLALVFAAVAGPDPLDPLSDRPHHAMRGAASPRIAVTEDFGVAPVSRAVRAGFREAVASLARHFPVAEAHPDCADAIETFHVLRPPLIHAAYARLPETHGDLLTPTVRWWIELGAKTSAADWLAAEARRTELFRRFTAFFEHFDLLIAPAAAILPWPNEAGDPMEIDGEALPTLVDYLAVTFILSLVGFPVVTLPAAWTSDGLPIGVQLIGRPGHDLALLAAARRIEAACGFVARPLPGEGEKA